jgi:hypothetical protein
MSERRPRRTTPSRLKSEPTIAELLIERSSPDRCNAVGEIFWYFHLAVVRKNENPGSKNLNKFANLTRGA